MRKRPTAAAAAVSSIDREAVSLKKKKRDGRGISRANLAFWGLVVLLAAILLRSPVFTHAPTEDEKLRPLWTGSTLLGAIPAAKLRSKHSPEWGEVGWQQCCSYHTKGFGLTKMHGAGVVALESVEEEDELLFVPKSIIMYVLLKIAQWRVLAHLSCC